MFTISKCKLSVVALALCAVVGGFAKAEKGDLAGGPLPPDWKGHLGGGSSTRAAATPTPASSSSLSTAEIERLTLEAVRRFELGNAVIAAGGQCERILVDAAQRLERPLTDAEVALALPKVLNATGEALVRKAAPAPRRPGPFCFTEEMLVLTPSGERPIADLRPGDEVISFDLHRRQIVTNTIANIFLHPAEPFSRLVDLPRPIDVTGRHQFFAQDGGLAPGYYPIEEIPERSCLLYSPIISPSALSFEKVQRGRFLVQPSTAHVFDLQMTGEPRNFIVHGVLVHNVPLKVW